MCAALTQSHRVTKGVMIPMTSAVRSNAQVTASLRSIFAPLEKPYSRCKDSNRNN